MYDGYEIDRGRSALTCRYSLGEHRFTEQVTFDPAADWDAPFADDAARLVFLLAGVSYYKTAAPEVVDLRGTPVSPAELALLSAHYRDGLAEFAFRNGLQLERLELAGGRPRPTDASAVLVKPLAGGRPLIPFGGGIDSIVTVESVRSHTDEPALFVVDRPGDRFAAIECAAAVTGLPIRRASRAIDPSVRRSAELGFLNGHVPVTGIVSAIAVLAALLDHRDTVVMSNEWSASLGNVESGGRVVNHQWSKGWAFESAFRDALTSWTAAAGSPPVEYFSLLRPFSELWVAERFAAIPQYHGAFRSCNRSFHLDPDVRLDDWCGVCDKCCFIDLILAPFLTPDALGTIFGGREPLADPGLAERFRTLLGTSASPKPFECVGDVDECRMATRMAAARPDRDATPLLAGLVGELNRLRLDDPGTDPSRFFGVLGPHFVPDRYLPGPARR